MKTRFFVLLLLLLLPVAVRAQQAVPVRLGDTIELRISGVPNEEAASVNGVYTIDDQGNINLPYIQKVKILGLLPTQIQEAIQSRYISEKIYTHPTITVQQNALPRFVNVMGEVKAPQRVAFTADMTLMTAINACNGFTDFANKNNIDLKRGSTVTKYRGIDIEHGKVEDPPVQPGDMITVHQGF